MDNPNGADNELFNLSIGMDTSPAQRQFDAFIAYIEENQGVAFDAIGKGNDSAHQLVNDLQDLKDAAFKGGEGLADLRKEAEYVVETFDKLQAKTQAVSGDVL